MKKKHAFSHLVKVLKRGLQCFSLSAMLVLLSACGSEEDIQQVSYDERIDLNLLHQPTDRESIYSFAMLKGSEQDSKAQQAFVRYLSRASGYSFKLVNLDNGAQIAEQLGDDEVQFALLGIASLLPSITEYGVQPIAKAVVPRQTADVQAHFIVLSNSPLSTLGDIKGYVLALGDKSSLSSAVLPLTTLASRGIPLSALAQLSYTGSNKQCISALLSRAADVCAVPAGFAKSYVDNHQVRILEASDSYPSNTVVTNLYTEDEVQKKLLQTLENLPQVYKQLSLNGSRVPREFSAINKRQFSKLSETFRSLRISELGP